MICKHCGSNHVHRISAWRGRSSTLYKIVCDVCGNVDTEEIGWFEEAQEQKRIQDMMRPGREE